MYVIFMQYVHIHVYVTMKLFLFFLAICSQECYNGGTCTSPGNCTCVKGWQGHDCRTGNYFYKSDVVFTYRALDYIHANQKHSGCNQKQQFT